MGERELERVGDGDNCIPEGTEPAGLLEVELAVGLKEPDERHSVGEPGGDNVVAPVVEHEVVAGGRGFEGADDRLPSHPPGIVGAHRQGVAGDVGRRGCRARWCRHLAAARLGEEHRRIPAARAQPAHEPLGEHARPAHGPVGEADDHLRRMERAGHAEPRRGAARSRRRKSGRSVRKKTARPFSNRRRWRIARPR